MPKKVKRPLVVEAYMTHAGTPLITEVLKDGRIRKVGREQWFNLTGAEHMALYREIYGNRWTGIHMKPKRRAA